MPTGKLFANVQPERITHAALVLEPGANQRTLRGADAQSVAATLQRFEGEFVASDRIQPWSFDFVTGLARLDQTPLMFMVTVREDWSVMAQQNGVTFLKPYVHITGLAVYDVGITGVRHARQWQGHPQYEMRYHSNSIIITSDDNMAIMKALFKLAK